MSEVRESILQEITKQIDDLLAEAPNSISESRRTEVRDEAVAYAQRVTEACSTEELQSNRAFHRLMDNVATQVRTALPKGRYR